MKSKKQSPGRVRDAIIKVLGNSETPLTVARIEAGVRREIGETPTSSIRSYLRLNTPGLFVREARGVYRSGVQQSSPRQPRLEQIEAWEAPFAYGKSNLQHDECFAWMERRPRHSVQAIVTDPPYGLHEYTEEQQSKLRAGRGGVWRLPPAFDGHRRSPVPRFTTLDESQLQELHAFFFVWGKAVLPALVPGANVVVASNPLVSHIVAAALARAGLERRGEIVRLTMTMRGGDRPKGAHDEFAGVSVMPRSMWEPWLVFRKPLEGRVQDNLRKWRTGGFRRPGEDKPFGDVIASAPTRRAEKALAPHPSLKPQAFLRQLVRGVLPLGEGVVLDTFAGAGSTLAACNVVGYDSIGIEKDREYFLTAVSAIPKLTEYTPRGAARLCKSNSPGAS
ncbi:MAG: DNA methyltransferase [Gammaproteobacteria bacterium]|nr:DNA methyltransferase [Gammaproteobacteria bacterium]